MAGGREGQLVLRKSAYVEIDELRVGEDKREREQRKEGRSGEAQGGGGKRVDKINK